MEMGGLSTGRRAAVGVRGSPWSPPWGKVGGEGREHYALRLSQPSSVEGPGLTKSAGALCAWKEVAKSARTKPSMSGAVLF